MKFPLIQMVSLPMPGYQPVSLVLILLLETILMASAGAAIAEPITAI